MIRMTATRSMRVLYLAQAILIGFTYAISLTTLSSSAWAAQTIEDIVVRGNGRVESDAIVTIIKSRKGDSFSEAIVKEDMKTLFELGYFSDLRFFKKDQAGGVVLIIQVAEKPAITTISFEGMVEVKEDDLKDKIETKLYTIVNESKLTADLRVIEKQYAEKGFYLARVTYVLDKAGPNDVHLKYVVNEGEMVQVGDVVVNGNAFFTDEELVQRMASQPFTRSSAYGSSSLFKDDFVKNDLGYLSYIYKDNGFAEVQVAKPHQVMDPDRGFVRLTYKVEEGLQYNIGTLDLSGDLLFTKEELFEAMKLKTDALFKYSYFSRDIEMLTDKYGDLGYAYADVNPIVTYDREKRLAHINYEITKGEKIYFGDMTIIGNTKTRDNVMRREFQVADAALYHGTGLGKTKKEMSRLGFFEDIQIVKERSDEDESVLDLKYKVKEKPTGQLQASVGYTPPQGGAASGFFGQGAYEEQNQNGFGYQTHLRGKWNGDRDYSLDLGFTNPRVDDGPWLAGTSLQYSNSFDQRYSDVSVEQTEYGGTVFVGRKLIEEITARVTYQLTKIEQKTSSYLIDKFQVKGLKSSMIFSLGRYATDNRISATEGSEVTLRQKFTGGPILKGDFEYMETTLDGAYYYPVDIGDSFRTNFRLYGNVSYMYPLFKKPIPFTERYKLGGYNDMRGFEFDSIAPRFYLLRAPGDEPRDYPRGGDKKMYYQFEYFVPLIQEAGIKALLFSDFGRVYDDNEAITFKGLYKDVGFGFRWQTPIAPFRFEWAYPIEEGRLGESRMIFSIGY
jgi:outer membrane protein insertion porin family